MPIKQSQIKAMKQANAARERNRAVKADFRGKVKAVKKAAETGSKEVGKLTSEAIQAIDKAAKRGVIHPTAANRRKSRLVGFLNKAMGKSVVPASIKDPALKGQAKKVAKPAAKKTTKKTTK